jgi:hypothetical protein
LEEAVQPLLAAEEVAQILNVSTYLDLRSSGQLSGGPGLTPAKETAEDYVAAQTVDNRQHAA